VVFWVIL